MVLPKSKPPLRFSKTTLLLTVASPIFSFPLLEQCDGVENWRNRKHGSLRGEQFNGKNNEIRKQIVRAIIRILKVYKSEGDLHAKCSLLSLIQLQPCFLNQKEPLFPGKQRVCFPTPGIDLVMVHHNLGALAVLLHSYRKKLTFS